MASGRANQITKQAGEYLVAAELCRRGFIATTFTGNVPHYDIITSNEKGGFQAVQVKAIKGGGWQFDSRVFMEIKLEGKKQVIMRPTKVPYPGLIFVFVLLRDPGTDEFYILTWSALQKIAIAVHGDYLKKHGGIRPKKHDSFHMVIHADKLTKHQDKWNIIKI